MEIYGRGFFGQDELYLQDWEMEGGYGFGREKNHGWTLIDTDGGEGFNRKERKERREGRQRKRS